MLIAGSIVGCRMPAPEHAPAFHEQHKVAMLVVHVPFGPHQTHIGFGAHGPRRNDFVLQVQGVIGQYRFFPLQIF